ncbi:MAG: 50S ribosomal protein L29 [Nitrospirae bacterium]|nr:50S ribosomal protein L29 [Nitrospirota bacterium]MBI3594624.1 50S ribosomal protein L29 [Nitrospirota bacterium]
MKVKDLRNLSGEDLLTRKGEFKKELFNLRCQIVLGKMENLARVRTIRRDVARIETIMKESQAEKSLSK